MATCAALFSLSLGIVSVAVPLLAKEAGFGVAEIGVYISLSAVAQLATRLTMPALLRRSPDRFFVLQSGLLMAASCAMIAVSLAWWCLALSQVLQGVARAFFWTGGQTHAVRTSAHAAQGVAAMNLTGGVGLVAGPAIAGFTVSHWSGTAALWMTVGVGVAMALPASRLLMLPPLAGRSSRARAWAPTAGRPGVATACWAGATAGAWRGTLSSYVPLILDRAGQSSARVGLLVAVANLTSLAAGGATGMRAAVRHQRLLLAAGVVAAGAGIAALSPVAAWSAPAGMALALSGLGAGCLETLAPALAARSVDADEVGDAIVDVGTFRSTSMFVAPVAVAAVMSVVPLGAAVVATGLVMTGPLWAVLGWHPPDRRST